MLFFFNFLKMLPSKIYQSIDLIGTEKFVNNIITIKLPTEACFFLKEFTKSVFEPVYNVEKRRQLKEAGMGSLLSCGVDGLRMKQTENNSLEDRVHPDFLADLKKITQTVLIQLASGWVKCEGEKYSYFYSEYYNWPKDFKIIKSPYQDGPTHCILGDMISLRDALKGRIKINGTNVGDYVGGESKDLIKFSRMLREETMLGPYFPSLKQISSWFIISENINSENIPNELKLFLETQKTVTI